MLTIHAADLIKEARTRLVSSTYGKFIDEDISRDARLADAALDYIKEYSGDFEFLVSIKDQFERNGRLSFRQLASVVNCMVADMQRQERQREREVDTAAAGAWNGESKIPNGIYTVKFDDGSYRTIRLRATWESRKQNVGEQVACYLAGSDNESDYAPFAFVHHGESFLFKKFAKNEDLKNALAALLADPETAKAMGVEYARQSGNCYVCNRQLTTPESIEAGIGPICAGRI